MKKKKKLEKKSNAYAQFTVVAYEIHVTGCYAILFPWSLIMTNVCRGGTKKGGGGDKKKKKFNPEIKSDPKVHDGIDVIRDMDNNSLHTNWKKCMMMSELACVFTYPRLIQRISCNDDSLEGI